MAGTFEKQHTFEERVAESRKILEKFPDRVPVIVEKGAKGGNVPEIDKNKYLVPKDLSVGKFIFVIRKRIQLSPEHALYVYANGTLPATNDLMGTIYEQNKKEDGFLYMHYNSESTFGCDFELISEDDRS